MTNIIGFPHTRWARRKIRAEACAWLARLDAGATEADKEALQAWLAQKPEHREVMLDVARQWDEMSVLEELAQVFPLKRQAAALASTRHTSWQLAAAAVICALGAGIWFMLPQTVTDDAPAGATSATALRYETRIGEQQTIALGDGSQIILNTNSFVEVSYDATERSIELQRGEAHFVVAKDTSRPFRVNAGRGVVEALGTAFAVQREDDGGIEVTVTEGQVNFSRRAEPSAATAPAADGAAQNAVQLMAGERAHLGVTLAAIEKESIAPVEIETELAWRHGMLLFQNSSLGDVLDEFSRYTPVRIEADAAVLDTLVYAYLPAGDVDQLLTYLRDSLNLQVTHVATDHIVLSAQ